MIASTQTQTTGSTYGVVTITVGGYTSNYVTTATEIYSRDGYYGRRYRDDGFRRAVESFREELQRARAWAGTARRHPPVSLALALDPDVLGRHVPRPARRWWWCRRALSGCRPGGRRGRRRVVRPIGWAERCSSGGV